MNQKISLIDNLRCFACGPNNPDGLALSWHVDGLVMSTYYIPEAKYQGWEGIVHGGILATLLDEAMTRLAGVVYGSAVTAEITIRYIKPALIGQKLYIQGEIVQKKKKLIEMKAHIQVADSQILIAQAKGKAIQI
jgi:uncharacterized protein (TIGR00369 family)